MICLDSSFIIDLLRNKLPAVKKAEELKNENLAISSISVFEILFGIYMNNSEFGKRFERFKILLDNLQVFDLDVNSSFISAKISSQLSQDGKDIGHFDCLIAGTMLSNGCNRIVTANEKHFNKIKNIIAENY